MCDRGRGLFHALLCVVCFVEAQIAAGASGTADVCRATPCNAARDTSEVLGSALHSQRCFSLLAAWPLPLRGGFKGSVSFSFGFMDPSLGHPRPFLVLPRCQGQASGFRVAGSSCRWRPLGSKRGVSFSPWISRASASGRGCRGHAPAHRRLKRSTSAAEGSAAPTIRSRAAPGQRAFGFTKVLEVAAAS